MSEILEKLRPDRDLQCYFLRPSAIAALSATSPNGFTVSGSWRQQFDWAVVEWNRDNVFEHPALRNLPDGDLSGIRLHYEETRTNCIPLDSSLFPTVDWPYLRVWAETGDTETIYKVPLTKYATTVQGSYVRASADFELTGTPTGGDYVGLSFLSEHHTYQLYTNDTLVDAVNAVADSIHSFSSVMDATAQGTTIQLRHRSAGANGNRVGVYSYVSGAGTESWSALWKTLSGGQSPTRWAFDLDFSALDDVDGNHVPTESVRKLRWTWGADLQPGAYLRSEFEVAVSNWTVTGTGKQYRVAGPGSFRIEDDSAAVSYHGEWTTTPQKGNFSGGTIRYTTDPTAGMNCTYECRSNHELWLGTRRAPTAPAVRISVDGGPENSQKLTLGEDVLVRIFCGAYGPGQHTVHIEQGAGPDQQCFYFDFLEVAIPNDAAPEYVVEPKLTLATDWDTDHSIALAPERTAWLVHTLGFGGRANHYVGALWFYELTTKDHKYASGAVTFSGSPQPSIITTLTLGYVNAPAGSESVIQHLNHAGDTAETIAKAFELIINTGYNAVWASAAGAVLTIQARAMGAAGHTVTMDAATNSTGFSAACSGTTLAGGDDGDWITDVAAMPRLNRAARDWCRSYYVALAGSGIGVTAAFSLELQHGDPSTEAGLAQRYPSGNPVTLNTPAVQTNFSPTSTAFWQQVYRDMAAIMVEAGVQPYLQFGEVQWWYFADDGSGLPFYDDFTKSSFYDAYRWELRTIPNEDADPAAYPEEAAFLPGLIGAFTSTVMSYVRAVFPNCKFEVLYPTDVNAHAFTAVVNFPAPAWTPATLDCMKTESFTYTLSRDLDLCQRSMDFTARSGFARSRRSHLVGIGDESTPWLKEVRIAEGDVGDSVVLFALDQFCLIGYPLPLKPLQRRSTEVG